VREPKDAPVGREKCVPMVGVRGEVIVKPRRLSVVAVSIANIDFWVAVICLLCWCCCWCCWCCCCSVMDNCNEEEEEGEDICSL